MNVTLLESKYVPSASSIDDARMSGQGMSMRDALETELPGDFHFVSYRLRSPMSGEEICARVVKRGDERAHHSGSIVHRLGADELRELGYRVETEFLVADWDQEGHATWASGEAAVETLDAAVDLCRDLELPPWAAYTSRAGFRLIWRLSESVDVDLAEKYLAGIIRRASQQGLVFDLGCLDWTRLFRLPRVERDGVQQSQLPWFKSEIYDDAVLDIAGLKKEDPRRVRSDIGNVFRSGLGKRLAGMVSTAARGAERPQAETAELLAWIEHPDATAVGQQVFRSMNHRNTEQTLKYGRPPRAGSQMGRNSTIVKIAGSLVRAALKVPEATQELIFGLMCPWIAKFELLPGDEDWYELAWLKIVEFWERGGDEEELRRQAMDSPTVSPFELEQRFLDSFRNNCSEFVGDVDDDDLRQIICDFSIVGRSPTDCFRLTPHGTYFPAPERWAKCVHEVLGTEVFGQEVHAKYRLESDDGKVRVLDTPTYFDKVGHTGHVHEVRYSASKRDMLQRDSSGMITLNVQIHKIRADVEPKYQPLIDQWLRDLLGAQWETCERYLQMFTFADRPIAALVMSGASRAGKSLLMAAMGSCFSPTGAVRNMGTSRFNLEALNCPVWAYDEALPTQASDVKRFDSYLREMISGGWVPIERKGHDKYYAEMFPRFVFSSNNDNILRKIFGSSDLTGDDQDALAERLIIARVPPEARAAVDRAKEFYRTEPDLLQAVVRHLFWMRDQADLSQAEERLLVSGKGINDAEISKASSQAPETVAVANLLCWFASARLEDVESKRLEGLHQGQMQLTYAAIREMDRKRQFAGRRGEEIKPRQVKDVLDKHRISYTDAGQLSRPHHNGTLRGMRINLMSMMQAFMPVLDMEMIITEPFDRHMNTYYKDAWRSLKILNELE